MDINIPVWTTLLVLLSYVLIAVVRRSSWIFEITFLVSLLIVFLCFAVGQWMDGLLVDPLHPPASFIGDYLKAWSAQSIGYGLLLRRSPSLNAIRAFEFNQSPNDELDEPVDINVEHVYDSQDERGPDHATV